MARSFTAMEKYLDQAGNQHRPSASIAGKPLNDAQIFGAKQKALILWSGLFYATMNHSHHTDIDQ